MSDLKTTSSSAIAERPRCRVGVMAKCGRLELGDNICGQYRSIFNHCDVFGQQKVEIGEKMQNKGCYAVQGHPRSSKVIKVGINATSY